MAKAVGLDAGEREIRLVELEGSYRRTRLSKITVEPVETADADTEADEHAADKADATLHAFKGAQVGRDHVTLGFPSRETVFRNLMVPFTGRDQIRKVIKFEVEGSIHSHSVDDMVVDFHTVGERDGESEVIVAAAPKSGLLSTLDALERHGIEPEFVDSNAMALYRVADWYGAFSEQALDDGEEATAGEAEEAVVPVTDALTESVDPVRVVLDIGTHSTEVLLVVRGVLVDVRTLRCGEATVVEELSQSRGLSLSEARQALGHTSPPETSPPEVDEPRDFGEEEFIVSDEEDEEEASPALSQPVPEEVVGAAVTAFLDRFRRELIRFLASVKQTGPIEALWVTGGGSYLPGMEAVLEEVFGCAPRWLYVLDRLTHNLDEDEVRELEPRVAVAVGLALGSMGGPTGFNFRQEDLAFTRGFDRVKFPLAITCMVALFLVVVFAVKSWRDLQWLEYKYGQTYSGEEPSRGRPNLPMFQGYLAYLLNPPGSWFAQIANFESNEYRKLLADVDAIPVFGQPPGPPRLELIQRKLAVYLNDAREETGVYSDLSLESGFAVLVRWAEVLERVEQRLGRYLVMDVEINLPYNASSRWLKFTVALRGEFRGKHAELVRAFEEECADPLSPFSEIKDEGREGIFVNTEERGSYYSLTIGINAVFDPFVPAVTGGD